MLHTKKGIALWFVSIVLVQGALLQSAAAAGGVGYYSSEINWSFTAPLYYSVAGGPPNVCGDIHTKRNGVWIVTLNWICTDASGNATKGPWTWAATPTDQTDNPTYITWPDGTSTTQSTHIWDKTCPRVVLDSPSGSPPTSYYGHATDAPWGAGFYNDWRGWTTAYSTFEDLTTGRKWTPSSVGYTATEPPAARVPATVPTYAPTPSVAWSNSFPPASAHVSGHTYRWQTWVTDGACGNTVMTFTVP